MSHSPPYAYSPTALLSSFAALQDKEEELLERSSGDAPMDVTNAKTPAPMIVAATQLTGAGLPDSDVSGFCFRAEQCIELAAANGANLILLPELWAGPYFCQSQEPILMGLAVEAESNVLIKRMQLLAKLYGVVLPVSFYERKHNVFYNSIIMIDSDGSLLGTLGLVVFHNQ